MAVACMSKDKQLAQLCYDRMLEKFPRNTDCASSAAVLLANITCTCLTMHVMN